jgi:hypothetical protein
MWDWNLRLCVPDKGGEVSYERGLMKDGPRTLVAKKPNTLPFYVVEIEMVGWNSNFYYMSQLAK